MSLVTRQGAATEPLLGLASRQLSASLNGPISVADVLEATTDCVLVIDNEGRITFVNKRAMLELGIDRAVLGRSLWELAPGLDEYGFGQHYRTCMANRLGHTFEANYSSTNTWYEVQVAPLGDGLTIFFRNVNQRKLADAALRQSEERYRLASRATSDVIWDFDLLSNTQIWSESNGEKLGNGTEQLEGAWGHREWLQRIHPYDRQRVVAEVADALQSEDHYAVEYRLEKSDGQYAIVCDRAFIVRDKGRPVRIVGATQDLTTRRRVEGELADRERQLAMVFEGAMVGIVHKRLSDGMLMVNERFCEIVGRSREELKGLGAAAVTHPDDVAATDATLKMHLGTAQPFTMEKRYLRPDGSVVWCDVSASFLTDERGEATAMILIVDDITARRTAETELRTSRDLLQAVIDGVDELITVKDRTGRFVLINKRVLDVDGAAIGRRITDFGSPEITESYADADRHVMETGDQWTAEDRIPIAGHLRYLQTVKVPWWNNGEIAGVIGVSRDTTARRTAEEALRQSEERFRLAAEAAGLGICDCDLLTNEIVWSEPARRILGVSSNVEATVELAVLLTHPDDRSKVRTLIDNMSIDGPDKRIESTVRMRRADDGAERWLAVGSWKTITAAGSVRRVILTLQDITEKKIAEDRVKWAADHDALTELPNRKLLSEHLEKAFSLAQHTRSKIGLLFLDLDHFKQINDTLGHAVGDAMLKTFAERLRGCLRGADTVARTGGDEFAILLTSIDGEEDLLTTGSRVMASLAEPFLMNGQLIDGRASIGACLYPDQASNSAELFNYADAALRWAKTDGRGRVMIFEGSMRAELQRRTSMLSLARQALDADRILPYYQAKVDLRSGTIIGFEALLRWKHRSRLVQRPALISAAFDDHDLAVAIGDRMFERVIVDMQGWLERGVEFGSIAINASAADFRRNDFAERVLDRLRRADVPASRIELEVTETVFLGRGAQYVEDALRTLSCAGVRIALDDFGTGFASLSHLKQFPVNVIKIDQSFVQNLGNEAGDAAIVQAVINLGASLGIEVVAEGIETAIQADQLKMMGCELGQGYLFSRPSPARRIPGLIRYLEAGQK